MPEPDLLRLYDSWENGIGHLRDDGSPSLYTSDKILGLRGELRPAPAATQVTIDADSGHHFQYFFEEPITTVPTPTLDDKSISKVEINTGAPYLHQHTLHTIEANEDQILVVFVFVEEIYLSVEQVSLTGEHDLICLGSHTRIDSSVSVWYFANPPTGTSQPLYIQTNAIPVGTDMIVSASTWYNVDLTGPFGEIVSDDKTNDAGPARATVISNASEVIVAGGCCTDSVQTMTVDDETEINQDVSNDLRGATSYETGAASVNMDWTLGAACDWIVFGVPLIPIGASAGTGPRYLYAQRGKKSGSSSTVKVNKTSLSNTDFGATSTTSYHDLTPLKVCGQPIRYQGYWWFPMGDNQKARRLQVIGTNIVDSTSNINEGATFTATDTTLTVDDGTDFTDDDYIKIESEILKVTAISGNDLTVVRAQYGTTAATHTDTTDIYLISVGNDTLDATATPFTEGADHLALLNYQAISILEDGTNTGGARILKVDGDIGTAADWGSPFQVGDKNERAAGLASLMGASFVLNVEGLYSFNSSGRSGMVFEDFRSWRHVFDNISIKPWRQGLLLSHPTGLLYYTPGQLPVNVGIDISPAEAAIAPPGPPILRGGRYHSTAPIGDFVAAIYQPDLSSTTVNVLMGYSTTDAPNSLVWQHLATTELQDRDHMLGCYITVGSKPVSPEYVTPTLWYGNGDDIDYIVLNSRASPFRTREDTHAVTTSGDAYFPEIFFPIPHKITHIVVHTQDMTSGDEWQISAIINAGDDINVGGPIKTSQRAKRPLNRESVYRLMLHVNWKATSTSDRVPPTIKQVEVWGSSEKW